MFIELLSKFAKLIVNYCIDIKKGNSVMIWGPVESIPLMNEIYREVLREAAASASDQEACEDAIKAMEEKQ